MKQIMTCLFVVVSVQTFAQSKWSLGAVFAPDVSGMCIPSDDNPNILQFDKPAFGYQAGVKGKFDFNTIVSAQLGLSLVSPATG